MTNEIDLLRQYRPVALGPSPNVTTRARKDFTEFLESQRSPGEAFERRPPSRRWQRRIAVAGIAALLLVLGGVAIGQFVDGVFYSQSEIEVIRAGELSLVIQESNIGPCLEVRTTNGSMSGGCGADFTVPLSVEVGLIEGSMYTSGWAPPGTTLVIITFPNAEEVRVSDFAVVEEYEVVFFMASPVPQLGDHGPMFIKATAHDAEGNVIATLTQADG